MLLRSCCWWLTLLDSHCEAPLSIASSSQVWRNKLLVVVLVAGLFQRKCASPHCVAVHGLMTLMPARREIKKYKVSNRPLTCLLVRLFDARQCLAVFLVAETTRCLYDTDLHSCSLSQWKTLHQLSYLRWLYNIFSVVSPAGELCCMMMMTMLFRTFQVDSSLRDLLD